MKESYQFIHNTVIHWIEKADSKAEIMLGIKLFILGYFIQTFEHPNDLTYHSLIYITYSISSLLSFYFLVKIVYPKLSTKEPNSLIYFKHLDSKYSSNKKQGVKDLMNMSEEDFKNDLINQILSLSFVSSLKYQLLQKSFIFLMLEVASVILLRYI